MNPHPFPVPLNEKARLKALRQYELPETLHEKEYDFITTMAAQICKTKISFIALLDEKIQYIKSSFGFELKDTPRELSLCNYTILDPKNANIVTDLKLDNRYRSNPLVIGDPHAVFYAGAPLVTPNGYVIGSICVLHTETTKLSKEQKESLQALALQTIITMELRKKNKELKLTHQKLKKTNNSLKELIKLVSHDMKTPLANISMLSKGFRGNYKNILDKNSDGYIELIEQSATGLISFIDQMVKKSKKKENTNYSAKPVSSINILKKVIQLLAPQEDITINIKGKFPNLNMDKIDLQQVFQNLITNAIKYNDKPRGIINVTSESDNKYYYFHIIDNGTGIANSDLKKIFKNRQTLGKTDRYGNKGTGIGLAKVKSIIEAIGGSITVSSTLNKGTEFKISIPKYHKKLSA